MGDVVLVFDENLKRVCWKMAIVENVMFGRDQEVRRARVKVITTGRPVYINRPVQKLYPLKASENEKGVEKDKEEIEVKEKGVDERSKETKESGGEEGKMKDEVEYRVVSRKPRRAAALDARLNPKGSKGECVECL